MHLHTLFVLSAAFIGGISCAQADPLSYASTPNNTYVAPKQNATTLLDVIKSRPDLSDLAQSLQEPAGFTQAFDTPATWQFTFFAPSNTAFNNTGAYFSTWRETPKGKWWLGNTLTHHYVPNTALKSKDVTTTLSRLQTGTYLYVSVQQVDGSVVLNKVARVVEADIAVGTNGVMHVIDRILDPSAQIYEGELPKQSQGFIPGSCSNPQLPYC